MHLPIGFGGLEEPNPTIVRIADEPRKLFLAQLALHTPAIAAGPERKPGHLHPGLAESYPFRRRVLRSPERKPRRHSQGTGSQPGS